MRFFNAQTINLIYRLLPRPRDMNTESGRSEERYSRVAITSVSAAVAKLVSIAALFVSIRLSIHYLGLERYAVWITISSLVMILTFADFGIGNGLLNEIARCAGTSDQKGAARFASSAFFFLLAIAVVFSVFLAFGYHYVPWYRIFNVHSLTARQEAGPSVVVFFSCFAISLPFGIVQRIQLGYQEGYLNSFWSIGGSALGLLGLVLAIHENASLPWLIAAVAGAPALMLFANCVVLFRGRPWLRPTISNFSWKTSKGLLGVGFLFFVLQLAMAVGYQSDNMVIAQILGAHWVTQYAVPLKLFQVIPTFLGFFMLSLWPAYGEAAARGDVSWIRIAYRRSIVLNAAFATPLALILFLCAKPFIRLWVGDSVTPHTLLLAGMTILCITTTMIGPLSALLNGLRVLKFQAVTWSLMSIMNLCLSIILTRRIGVSGVVYGSIIAQVLFILIPSFWYIPHVVRKLERAPVSPLL